MPESRLAVTLGLLVACHAPPPPAAEVEPAEVVPAEPEPAKVDAPSEPGPDPEELPAPPISDADALAALAGRAEASENDVASAWSHYKAQRWAAAQASFAKATLDEPHAWKHPFNLACASARGGDERMARIGLTEALARDRASVERKASRDADLASVRGSGWFASLFATVDPAAASEVEPAGAEGERARTPPKQPKTTNARLRKPQLAAIAEQLATRHGLPVRFRSSLALTDTIAFVVYDYKRYDACLLQASKQECRKQLAGRTYEPRISDYECRSTWIARVALGGTIELAEPVRLEAPCKVDSVRRFVAGDFDGDGSEEVLLMAVGVRSTDLSVEADTFAGSVFMVLRSDGSVQLDLHYAWSLSTSTGPHDDTGHDVGHRQWLRDVDGDGRLDLEIESIPFPGEDEFDVDYDLWPALDEPPDRPVTYEVRLYDASTDSWPVAVTTE